MSISDKLELLKNVDVSILEEFGAGYKPTEEDRTCLSWWYPKILGHVPTPLVEFSAMAGFFGLPTSVWAVREYLPVDPLFHCEAYGGMPVVPERRYFVNGGELLYSIPYWPEQALDEGSPDDSHWKDKLPVIQQEFGPEAESMACKCGELCGGKWSVDVLLTRKGYYVTDMAEAEKSYGWRG